MEKLTDEQLAAMTLQLLDRVDLKGGEVPQFVQVRNWLMSQTQPAQTPDPSDQQP